MVEINSEDEELDEELESVKDERDQVLHFNYRGLRELPRKLLKEAHDFGNITRIYMKSNKLTTLPEDIGKLTNLVELYLHSNDLVSLPEGIGQLKCLDSLDVTCNRLASLPSSLCHLMALERLHLSNNKLQSLPKDIGKLKNLLVLEVMNNQLQHLIVEITECSSLQRLLLDRNQLRWLPRQLSLLSELEELSATGNKLLCLPMELGDMKSLRYLYVDNNPYLHAVPINIYSQELGFNSCGSFNFETEDPIVKERLRYVQIEHSDIQTKKIYVPKEIMSLGNRETACVPSLLELAMREVYRFLGPGIHQHDVPSDLYDLLTSPVAFCPCCNYPIFTSGFPVIFESQIRLYSVYRLGLCCSSRCVHIATLAINLPLIYPSMASLCMAVALVN